MAMAGDFVERCEKLDLKCVDQFAKNKFKWVWLEDQDDGGVYFSEFIRKKRIDGTAFCIICKHDICYGSAGQQIFNV